MNKKHELPTPKQLLDAVEHISFEMNRYLYTKYPKQQLPDRYPEVVAESCLLHSRNVGEFFFDDAKYNNDIRIGHYFDELISCAELKNEIEKLKSTWPDYKQRLNKKLSHLTYSRLNSTPMNMQESNDLKFNRLIELFKENLPEKFIEKWKHGESFSLPKKVRAHGIQIKL